MPRRGRRQRHHRQPAPQTVPGWGCMTCGCACSDDVARDAGRRTGQRRQRGVGGCGRAHPPPSGGFRCVSCSPPHPPPPRAFLIRRKPLPGWCEGMAATVGLCVQLRGRSHATRHACWGCVSRALTGQMVRCLQMGPAAIRCPVTPSSAWTLQAVLGLYPGQGQTVLKGREHAPAAWCAA